MYKEIGINEEIIELSNRIEEELRNKYAEIDKIKEFNSLKVLKAFQKYNLSEVHFGSTTGYGYDDIGRDTIEKIFAEIFNAEDSLVRTQLISGTHALTVALFAILRPKDTFVSITGKPYDTLDEVIGIVENKSSLKSFNINFKQIELVENSFDFKSIEKMLKNEKIKMITIQRSKGYSTRESISIEKIAEVIKFIKEIDKNVIIMVDNCYTEFVTKKEPIEVGADLIVRFTH